MTATASFRVDPRLTAILGESYSSSERALRELTDNAWDAEATEVHVTLPDILSDAPIFVADNGSGMKEKELRSDYLNIARPRLSRKGERTPNLLRVVKGRRGIGKFAGLILAETMEVETKAHGTCTRLTISKSAILGAAKDLEQVPLPVDAQPCPVKEHGTTVTLRNLNPSLNFPKVDKLREILAGDYGRETDFVILLNGERVFRHDILGQTFTKEIPLPNGQTAAATYTIAEKPVPGSKAGLILRVGGKSIGQPHLFGLEHDEMLSDRSKRRVVGEINLPPDSLELTAAGGDVIESDKSFEHLANVIQRDVKQSLEETHTNEVNLAKARWVQMMNRRLENVPEHRRAIVEDRLSKLISRSYQEGEKEERISYPLRLGRGEGQGEVSRQSCSCSMPWNSMNTGPSAAKFRRLKRWTCSISPTRWRSSACATWPSLPSRPSGDWNSSTTWTGLPATPRPPSSRCTMPSRTACGCSAPNTA